MSGRERRAGDEITLPVYLAEGECSIEVADGEVFVVAGQLDDGPNGGESRRPSVGGSA